MATYYVVPIVIVIVVLALGFGASRAARKSRAEAERYRSASPEERAELDRAMHGNFWLDARMRPMSIWSVLGTLLVAFLFMVVLKWLRS